MNALAVKQIHEDYRQILSTDAGKRVLGGIIVRGGQIHFAGKLGDFQQGRRSVIIQIMNTIHEVDPYGAADCVKAYEDLLKECTDNDNNGTNTFTSNHNDFDYTE